MATNTCYNPACGHHYDVHSLQGRCFECYCQQFLTEAPTIYGMPVTGPVVPGTLRAYASMDAGGILQRRSYTLHKTTRVQDMRQPLAGETQLETWLLDQVREWLNPANRLEGKPPAVSEKMGTWVLHLRWEPNDAQ